MNWELVQTTCCSTPVPAYSRASLTLSSSSWIRTCPWAASISATTGRLGIGIAWTSETEIICNDTCCWKLLQLNDGLVWNRVNCISSKLSEQKKVDLRLGLVMFWSWPRPWARAWLGPWSWLTPWARPRGEGSLPECQGRYWDDRQGPERRRWGWSTRTLGTRDIMSGPRDDDCPRERDCPTITPWTILHLWVKSTYQISTSYYA